MPRYFLRVPNGRYAGASDLGIELADRQAAKAEAIRVCGDLVGGVSLDLEENTDWRIELLDESKKPVFRIRLLAETVE
jgi:hypothetical protein